MKYLVITLVISFSLLSNSPSPAQWVKCNGLLSGWVTCVAADGNYIYAGILGSGLFISSNNGSTWASAIPNLPEFSVWSILINGDNLFAAANSGLYLSTDHGNIWTKTGLINLTVYGVIINDNNIFAGTSNGVYLSSNNGNSWTKINTGLQSLQVFSLLYLDNSIYAGTGGGVYRSTNNGTNWLQINNGLTSLTAVYLAAIDSSVFIATYGGGVFSITNNDTSWVSVNLGLTNLFAQSIVAKGYDLFVGTTSGGVFHSTDKGISWIPSNDGLSKFSVVSLVVSGTVIYAASQGDGIYMSEDNGLTWKQIGLPYTNVGKFIVNGNDLFCANSSGFAYSNDNGLNWEPITRGLDLSGIGFYAFTLSGSNIIIASDSGIFSSTNKGAVWAKIYKALNDQFQTDDHITAIAVEGPDVYIGTHRSGLFLSTDSGDNWKYVENSSSIYDIRSMAMCGNNVLLGTLYGIYCSSDMGATWDEPVFKNKVFSYMASDGNNVVAGGMNILKGDSLNIFISTDKGMSWKYTRNDPYVHMMNDVSISGSNVFVCADNYASFSTDYGAKWTIIKADTFHTSILSLLLKDSYILAGTYGAGVWRRPFSELTGLSNDLTEIPKVFTLSQNYPNPFNPATVITYSLPSASNIKLVVYNTLGQAIKTLESGYKPAGNYSINFNAPDLPSGIYFYKLEAGSFSQIKKMILIK